MSDEIVTNKSVTYVNNTTPVTITSSELDLRSCYQDDEVVIEVHAAALNQLILLLTSFVTPTYLASIQRLILEITVVSSLKRERMSTIAGRLATK